MKYYKFQSSSFLNILALSNCQLVFGGLNRFNDVFDGHVVFRNDNDAHKEYFNSVIKDYEDKLDRRRFYCLASSDNVNFIENAHLMWAHYAEGHKGFCVEFNEEILSNFPLLETGKSNSSIKIKYPENFRYPELYVDNKGMLSETIDNILSKAVSTKHKQWEYEQEIRLISKVDSCYLVEPSAIEAIYLGVKIKDETKQELLKVACKLGIKCYQMSIGEDDEYKLEKQEIY